MQKGLTHLGKSFAVGHKKIRQTHITKSVFKIVLNSVFYESNIKHNIIIMVDIKSTKWG